MILGTGYSSELKLMLRKQQHLWHSDYGSINFLAMFLYEKNACVEATTLSWIKPPKFYLSLFELRVSGRGESAQELLENKRLPLTIFFRDLFFLTPSFTGKSEIFCWRPGSSVQNEEAQFVTGVGKIRFEVHENFSPLKDDFILTFHCLPTRFSFTFVVAPFLEALVEHPKFHLLGLV